MGGKRKVPTFGHPSKEANQQTKQTNKRASQPASDPTDPT